MNERLTFAQRMALTGASEEKRALIEEESSLWMVQCRHCGFEASVWDLGGVRYHARGRKIRRRHCPECDKRRAHDVYWAGESPAGRAPSRPGVADAEDQPRASPIRAAGRVDPLRPPTPPSMQRALLPVWLILVVLMAVGFFANEIWGFTMPIWLLLLAGFGIRGIRGAGGERQAADTRVTANFSGAGCLLVLGFLLLGWILSRGMYGVLTE